MSANGKSITTGVESGDDATYFGFYGTNGDSIASITIATPNIPSGFAIGQFGIDPVPEPSTLVLFGVGAAGLLCKAWRMRQRRR